MVRREAVPRVRIYGSQTLAGFLPPSHGPERDPVDIELLTSKRDRFFDYDYDYDNDNDDDENEKDCALAEELRQRTCAAALAGGRPSRAIQS